MAKPKFKIKHSISKKEWNKTHKDFKSIIDGVHYVMKLTDKGTALVPVNITESINEVERGDMGYVEKHKSIATVYDVMSGGKKVRVKLGKTGKTVVIDTNDIQILPESVNEEKVYIDFLNKKKGFKKDRIKFNSYEDAVKWAKKNFEKFNPDMIKYESVNEGKDPEIITQLRDVLKNGYKTLKDPKSGKRMKVDTYSASAIIGVYDKLNPSNQEKFVKQGLLGMQSLAFKFIK